ncbi:MAG TPA: TolC family protein [Gemmataceae bacterium]|nr:TolC family protein [Gemmataceae bacterium]
MISTQSPWRRPRFALLGKLVAPACLCLGPWLAAADEPDPPEKPPAAVAPAPAPPEVPAAAAVPAAPAPAPPEVPAGPAAPAPAPVPPEVPAQALPEVHVGGAAAPAPPKVQVLDLAACRRMALDKQPAIAAAQASLDAAQARAVALNKLHAIPLLASDLPIRRHQADLGVTAAAALLEQARWDAIYNVTRTYLAVIYARLQIQVASDAVAELETLKKTAEATPQEEYRAKQIAETAKVAAERRLIAVEGAARALAALREAVGLAGDACIDVADSDLPDLGPIVCRDDVLALALARRGEIVQAMSATEITALEVKAQASNWLAPSFRTYASGSDIHVQPPPLPSRGSEYNPGGLGPEMPVNFAGKRADRVEQAHALSARANAVLDKTRGLVVLEADNAFHMWQETATRLPTMRDAYQSQRKVADDYSRDAKIQALKRNYLEVTTSVKEAYQRRLDVNETYFHHLVNLAALERITAGGFCAGFEPKPAPKP